MTIQQAIGKLLTAQINDPERASEYDKIVGVLLNCENSLLEMQNFIATPRNFVAFVENKNGEMSNWDLKVTKLIYE